MQALDARVLAMEEAWVADPAVNSTAMGTAPLGSTLAVATELCSAWGVCK